MVQSARLPNLNKLYTATAVAPREGDSMHPDTSKRRFAVEPMSKADELWNEGALY
jgi:hypothetical protein